MQVGHVGEVEQPTIAYSRHACEYLTVSIVGRSNYRKPSQGDPVPVAGGDAVLAAGGTTRVTLAGADGTSGRIVSGGVERSR